MMRNDDGEGMKKAWHTPTLTSILRRNLLIDSFLYTAPPFAF